MQRHEGACSAEAQEIREGRVASRQGASFCSSPAQRVPCLAFVFAPKLLFCISLALLGGRLCWQRRVPKMLRPMPTRIELGPEDLEDFKEAQRRQREEAVSDGAVLAPPQQRSPTVAERIGYSKPTDPQRIQPRTDRI